MSLTHADFHLTDESLAAINRAIKARCEAFHATSPDEDPLDGFSVIFDFIPGQGREITVHIAGAVLSPDDFPASA